MQKKVFSRFTIILFIIGLMTAIQYNTVNEPNSRDTRDVWEIRQELSREKQLHSELLSEIGVLDETLLKYEAASVDSPEQVLQSTVKELKEQAGLTQISGPGIEVQIAPSLEAVAVGQNIEEIPPNLLIRFVNEVNRFKGLSLSIAGNRIVNTTAIRDINGETTVNTEPVGRPPFSIKIIAGTLEEIERVYNFLLASPLLDDFYVENLSVKVTEPERDLEVEAYEEQLNFEYLEAAEGE
ncbi:DUF881 domain-containing protein [Planococcus salinus]|uniref:DUF881 domain-containing protein n=1 Tax=Planococcus salinus TaxID=1848460 RepID=A0A3M8PAD6_9BACL|nr:DUF881 domain-containing protein [Planococcus salinus]RNF40675.1 DUF881 domain-containing protein [Planococcus salinus]